MVEMEKSEFIRRYGKKLYLLELEKNKLRNRAMRGYKNDNRGSWDRGVMEELRK